ncbi:MAG TPA: prepilin-type N-terminal cleavage/methylation domain-containing protein [Acidimicrobiales bacterium]|nr:prepilin-type N-terminal cleavage/methylation domain-containing protein [Acidimicrobiales bacterium]
MNRKLRRERTDEGFTLIELLIVVIILGILASIVVFAVGATRKDSVASSCKTDAKSIELSIEAVHTKTGAYPAAQAGVIAPSSGALLKTWPSSTDYTFAYASTGASNYTVTIAGPNVVGGSFTETSNTGIAAACAGT